MSFGVKCDHRSPETILDPEKIKDIAQNLADNGSPFCIINRLEAPETWIFKGTVEPVCRLRDIPFIEHGGISDPAYGSHRDYAGGVNGDKAGGVNGDKGGGVDADNEDGRDDSGVDGDEDGGADGDEDGEKNDSGRRWLDSVHVSSISMVPFRQITERGFKCRDGGEPILSLRVEEILAVHTPELLTALPAKELSFDITSGGTPSFIGGDSTTVKSTTVNGTTANGTTANGTTVSGATGNSTTGNGVADDEDDESSALFFKGITFTPSQAKYREVVEVIYREEICGGEGSSFVTPRVCSGRILDFTCSSALSIYRRLLQNEIGYYWCFLFFDGEQYFVGATPERHLTFDPTGVYLNPISGTFRKSNKVDDVPGGFQSFLDFLSDKKEIDELYMVTDEEIKMMCRICPGGGVIVGPNLKEMNHLIHTEYELVGDIDLAKRRKGEEKESVDVQAGVHDGNAGRNDSCLDYHDDCHDGGDDGASSSPREGPAITAFRNSMFAPTVTGSPMENACSRLYDYEQQSRRYYSSAIVLLGEKAMTSRRKGGRDQGRRNTRPLQYLDSAITIRCQELQKDGRFEMRVGATLVKDSMPSEEVKETEAKLMGAVDSLRSSLSTLSTASSNPWRLRDLLRDNDTLRQKVDQKLLQRNNSASNFWRMSSRFTRPPKSLAHIMRWIGIKCDVFSWKVFEKKLKEKRRDAEVDFIIVGPGPGNPKQVDSPRMASIARVYQELLSTASTQQFLSVCLGHQCLSLALGFEVRKKDVPLQGVQQRVDLYGAEENVGFYNSFYVVCDEEKLKGKGFEFADRKGELIAYRSPFFESFQFHPESILTENSVSITGSALLRLLDAKNLKK